MKAMLVLVGFVLVCGTCRVMAATSYTWNGAMAGGTYDFNTASNWTPTGVPGSAANDYLTFNNGTNSYTINTSAGVGTTAGNDLRSITLAKSTGTVTLNIGHTFNIGGNLATTLSDIGTTMNINNGGAVNFGTFSSGWNLAQIIRGGTVNVNGGGTLTIANSGSNGFVIGSGSGTGTLSVSSNGTLNVNNGLFRIGFSSSGSPSGVLTSSGTVVSNSGLRVGERTDASSTPAGTVSVNGGTFTVHAGSTFGLSAGGTGTLNVSGGTFTLDSNAALNIGSSGTGILNVSSGTLNVNTGSSAGQGRLTVAAASTYNQTGGTANIREFLSQVNAQARQVFSGGTLNVGSSFNAANGLIFRVGDGSGATAALNFQNTTTLLTTTGTGLYVATDGVLTGSATANSGSNRGNVNIDGLLAPGGVGVAGTLDIASGWQTNTGTLLNFELGGTSTSQYDRWLGSGQFFLNGGTLNVSLINGFTPSLNDTFDLFDFTSLAGSATAFDAVNLPALGGALSWDTSNLYTTGQISVIPEPVTLGFLGLGLAVMVATRKRNG